MLVHLYTSRLADYMRTTHHCYGETYLTPAITRLGMGRWRGSEAVVTTNRNLDFIK